MKIRDYAVHITQEEGGKKQVDIAQIMEILRIINWDTDGALYKTIRAWDTE